MIVSCIRKIKRANEDCRTQRRQLMHLILCNRRCTSSNRRKPIINKRINIVNSVVSNHNCYNYDALADSNYASNQTISNWRNVWMSRPSIFANMLVINDLQMNKNQPKQSMSRNLGSKENKECVRSFAAQTNEIIKGGFRIENNTIYKDTSVPFYNSLEKKNKEEKNRRENSNLIIHK